jgi:hypothetical protein
MKTFFSPGVRRDRRAKPLLLIPPNSFFFLCVLKGLEAGERKDAGIKKPGSMLEE